MNIGVIGTGDIFRKAYVPGCRVYAADTRIVRVADLDVARAEAVAAEFEIPRSGSVEALLADPEVDCVLNLTIPAAHAPVALQALRAGKHVYGEKPLANTCAEGAEVLAEAVARGLRVGCAPDTVLGAGTQTARAAIDAGSIGTPIAATAFMLCPGHESWHPSPAFYYQPGGGPLLDMGPYYLSSLITLLGPVAEVTGMHSVGRPEREVGSGPLRGNRIAVEVPTHISGTLRFANGCLATLIMSFETWGHHLPRIEVHGTVGSLSVPDPNGFGGDVSLLAAGTKEWQVLPQQHAKGQRGLGLADLAQAIRDGRPARASGDLAYHVLDVMETLLRAGSEGRTLRVASSCERPAAMLPTAPGA